MGDSFLIHSSCIQFAHSSNLIVSAKHGQCNDRPNTLLLCYHWGVFIAVSHIQCRSVQHPIHQLCSRSQHTHSYRSGLRLHYKKGDSSLVRSSQPVASLASPVLPPWAHCTTPRLQLSKGTQLRRRQLVLPLSQVRAVTQVRNWCYCMQRTKQC